MTLFSLISNFSALCFFKSEDLFQNLFLEMKKLEMKETKATYSISVLKVVCQEPFLGLDPDFFLVSFYAPSPFGLYVHPVKDRGSISCQCSFGPTKIFDNPVSPLF